MLQRVSFHASVRSVRRLLAAVSLALLLPAGARAQAQGPAQGQEGAGAPSSEAPPPPPAEAPAAGSPAAAAAPGLAEVEARLADVDQRSRIVERKLEILEEAAAAAKETAPVVAAGERGFNWKSPDGAFVVKVRGLIHADGREFFDDKEARVRDSFLIRRARPILEATFFDLADFRVMPDFGGGTAVLQDAYIDLRPFAWLKFRAGKFKAPVGLERLQSASAIVFPERAFPTSLAPNRDVGLMLHGLIGPGLVSYELGVFNGAADGASVDGDINHAKDFVGRLFLQPFKFDPYHLLANLGLGLAASTGNQKGTPAVLQTTGTTTTVRTASVPGLQNTFRPPGQGPTLFGYLVNDPVVGGTVLAAGRRTRLSPQGYFYYAGFGLLAEFIESRHEVARGELAAELTNRAWQVQASYVFGGKNAFEGVTVTNPFSVKKGTWGALEIAARYNALSFDADSFNDNLALAFADKTRSIRSAKGWAGVLNWHWSRNIKLALAFERTDYEGGATAALGNDRKPENVLFQRVQASF